jgi:aminopeptidase
MDELAQAVRAVVRDCLGVKEDEEVLVICNPATGGLGGRLRYEAQLAGGDAVLAIMSERASHAAEPPRTIAEAMKSADVILAPRRAGPRRTPARAPRPCPASPRRCSPA